MAVALDASLGQGNASAASSSNFSTTSAVASGAHIICIVGWFHNGASTVAVSGGSLTWTEDVVLRSGSVHISIQRAYAASGLASSTTITATFTGATPDSILGACSYTGIDTTGTVVASGSGSGTGTGWSSGSVASTSGNALIGGAFEDGATTASTPTSPGVEEFEKQVAGQTETLTMVDKVSVSGSDSIAGTWGTSTTWIAAAVCYKAAAGGGGGGTTVYKLSALGVG